MKNKLLFTCFTCVLQGTESKLDLRVNEVQKYLFQLLVEKRKTKLNRSLGLTQIPL